MEESGATLFISCLDSKMARQPSPATPLSLEVARRERASPLEPLAPQPAEAESATRRASVAAEDVVALLNRIGECVRALPSFGRSRTQTSAVRAKRTLSAISTCSAAGLADGDPLRAVLARLDDARSQVIRHAADHGESEGVGDGGVRIRQERIDELTLAAAQITAEIERLQQMQDARRSA